MQDLNSLVPAGHRPFKVQCFGLGDAGCRVVEHLSALDLQGISFIAANTDVRSLAQCSASQKFQLGAQLTRGLSTGGDFNLAMSAAEKDAPGLSRLCEGADLVFIIAGLGGGTGAGAGPVLARVAREAGALALAFAILPFDCEGQSRVGQARHHLRLLQRAADGVICLSNQKLASLVSPHASLVETFQASHELLAQGLRGIWRLLTRPGLIQLDFAHLASALRGKHSASAFAVAEARGPDRVADAVDKLLQNPFLDQGQLLADSETVLLSLSAGASLTIVEINRLVEAINHHTGHAGLILGTCIDESLGDRLEVTLITTARGQSLGPAAEPDPGTALPGTDFDLETQLATSEQTPARPATRCLPPPPELTSDQKHALLGRPGNVISRINKALPRQLQIQLPLDIISKGRFEKSEPIIRRGEDLDLPTFKRRGLVLN